MSKTFLRFVAITPLIIVGCRGESTSGRQFIELGTAPVGGAFHPIGTALSATLNSQKGDNTWRVSAQQTKGTQENIRRLEDGSLQFALLNASISYFAVRGESGWDKEYSVRSIMTLAPNIAMFITLKSSGIETLADLKGKRVVLGPDGAGFEYFLQPLLEAHGVTYAELTELHNTQSGAVDMIGDGQAAAAFLGGAVPTAAITQACSTHDIFFIPYDEKAKADLIAKYDFFQPAVITKDKYPDLEADYAGMNLGSILFATSANTDTDLVYQITKVLYEGRDNVTHGVKRAINEKNVVRNTGTPFHDGAIKYYKEIGIWPEADGAPSEKKADTKAAEAATKATEKQAANTPKDAAKAEEKKAE